MERILYAWNGGFLRLRHVDCKRGHAELLQLFVADGAQRLLAVQLPPGTPEAGIQQRMQQKQKLALYYCTQLDLFADLCAERASSCIAKLREQFGFDLLLSAVVSKTLPSQVKTAMCRLMLAMYIDFSPHEPLRLPRALRLVEDEQRPPSYEDWVAFDGRDWMADAMAGEAEEHSIVHQRKFLLLQDFIRDRYRVYDERVGQSTPFKRASLFGDQPNEQNEYTLTLVQVANTLVSYGFYGERMSIESIIHTMVTLLDGRADDDRSKIKIEAGEEATLPPSRYARNAHSVSIHEAKSEICKLLLSTADVLMHSAVTFAMGELRTQPAGREWVDAVTTKLRSPEFDLKHLSRSDSRALPPLPLEVICLDLLMYENDDIFESCFKLLRCHFLKHRVFREQFTKLNIHWGDEARRYRALEDQVALLRHLIESHSTWLRYEDTAHRDRRVDDVVRIFGDLAKAVQQADEGSDESKQGDAGTATRVNHVIQDMLRHMGIADLL
eukprot:g1350.t1